MTTREQTLSALGRSKTYIPFDEAQNTIDTLDKCMSIPITYTIPDTFFNDQGVVQVGNKTIRKTDTQTVTNAKGILNTGTFRIAGIVSPRYNPIDHLRAFNPIMKGIELCGNETMFHIENDRDTVRLECLFKDHKIHDDTSGGIIPGLRFTSGYSGKQAIKGTFYGIRRVCVNGAVFTKIVSEMNLTIAHLAKADKAVDEIQYFVDHILSNIENIESALQTAKETPITFDDEDTVTQILTDITRNAKDAGNIANHVMLDTNRYDLYNAITEYASHGDITRIRRDTIFTNAEKVLIGGETHYEAKPQAA